MKRVMLDYPSKEFAVTEEGYAHIRALITHYQLCDSCHQPITETGDHILVGKNRCVSCMLKQHSSLTFTGLLEYNSSGDAIFGFIDAQGVIYTSTQNTSTEAAKDIYISIQRANFPIPTKYKPFKAEKEVELGRYGWSVTGKLSQSVVVLEFTERYGQRFNAVFLSYKGGEVIELNKRNLAFKQMFERARKIIESTKHTRFGSPAYYHPDGYEISEIHDSALYPIIAQMESAVWDVQKAFMPKHTQPELTPEPQKEPEQPEPSPQLVEPGEENQEAQVQDKVSISSHEPDQTESVAEETPKRRHGRLSVVKNLEETPDNQEEEASDGRASEPAADTTTGLA